MRSPRPGAAPSPEVKPSEERRVEGRSSAEGGGEIMWVDQHGRRHSYAVSLRDASPSGRGVTVPQPVPVGQSVVLTLGDEIPVGGVTRYCRAVDGSYHVGVQLRRETTHR